MKAVRVHAYHEDPKIDDIPEPTLQGPLDVIVKIGGAGVCRTDLHIVNGDWAEAMNPGAALRDRPRERGLDRTPIGDGVTNVAVGDTVILHPQPSCGLCLPCRRGPRHAVRERLLPRPSNNDGGMAEYLRTTARACVKLDPEHQPRRRRRAGRRGHHRLPRGAQGRARASTRAPPPSCRARAAWATSAIQALAAITGTRIVVVDRNPDALALAKQIGADETVLSDGNHVDAVKDLTNGKGGDVVFDFVAEQGAELDAWQMTAPAGSHVRPRLRRRVQGPDARLRRAARRTSSATSSAPTTTSPSSWCSPRPGKVTLHTKQYPLDAALDALHDLDAGRVRGRAILVP